MGKVVLVTAATSGIGKAITKKILLESNDPTDRIIVNYRNNEERVKSFLSDLSTEDKEKIVLIKADLSCYDDMLDLVEKVKRQFSVVDWLICNVGVGTYIPFDEYKLEDWNRVMNTNVTIPVFMIQHLKDYISENGRIILMSSYCAEIPYSSSLVYGTSKAAISFLAKALVKEFEAKKVTVNAVAPGFIETDWQKGRSKESRERINEKIALHRFGLPEEVAVAVYSLLQNDYINGSVIDIHGGYNYF